jgi:hypothetical protein
VRPFGLEQKLLLMKLGLVRAPLQLEQLVSPSVGQADWIFDT